MDFAAALLQHLAACSLRALPVAFVAWAAVAAFRIQAAVTRHTVWTVVAAAMLLSAAFSPVLPPISWRILPAASAPVEPVAPVPSPSSYSQAASPRSPEIQLQPQFQPWTWQRYAACLYFAGLLFFAARLAFSYLFTRRLIRASRPVNGEWARDVYESTWIAVPMTVGFLHPRIFLPADWPQWEQTRLNAALAHERSHVGRADWAIGVMAAVNRCVFWFHPLSWWMERKLAALAEDACDDAALLLLGEREHYAQALLDMAAAVNSGHGRLVWEAMAMAKASEVKHRIERILDETRQIPQGLTRRRMAALLACSVPLLYVASALQLAPVHAQEQPKGVAVFTYDGALVRMKTFGEGGQLTPTEVQVLEQRLKSNPEDAQVRGQLLGYYAQREMRQPLVASVIWLIQNHPESELLSKGFATISPEWQGPDIAARYQSAAELWRRQIPNHLNDARVLGNAAQFFSYPGGNAGGDAGGDPAEAERLLQQARTLEPSNQQWLNRLAGLYVNSITAANRAAGNPAFGKANPQFAAAAALQLENSTDAELLSSVGRALSRYEVGPGQSRASALAHVSPGLTPLWELGDRLLARAQQFGAPRRLSSANAEPNVKRIEAIYPPLARQARIQGIVTLNVTVAQDGTVHEVKTLSGHPLLVRAAMEAVRQWTFGRDVAGTTVEVELPFELPGAEPGTASGSAPAANGLPELEPLTRVNPEYPALARQARIQGPVHLVATVGIDGHVTSVQAVNGHPLLVNAAIEAARQWTFPPQVELTKTMVRIQFRLDQ